MSPRRTCPGCFESTDRDSSIKCKDALLENESRRSLLTDSEKRSLYTSDCIVDAFMTQGSVDDDWREMILVRSSRPSLFLGTNIGLSHYMEMPHGSVLEGR